MVYVSHLNVNVTKLLATNTDNYKQTCNLITKGAKHRVSPQKLNQSSMNTFTWQHCNVYGSRSIILSLSVAKFLVTFIY